MRIVLIDPVSDTPPYDQSLARALGRRGHVVHLLTSSFRFGLLPRPEAFRREELFFPVTGRLFRRRPRSRLRLIARGLEYLPSVNRLLRRVDALRPDVVHVQWLPLPRSDVLWLRSIAARYPTLVTAHDVLPCGQRERRLWLEVVRAADAVVVHSRQAIDEFLALGADRTRIVCVTHPVFEAPQHYAPRPPRGRTLLFFGLLRDYKGLDVLVRALRQMAEAVPDVRLLVAGDPLDPVEPLQRLATAVGVADRIEWRLGFVPDNEIAALMGSAALVVLPYGVADASGVLATALGHGRPAVVSDVGSLGEIVRAFEAGAVVPPGDAPALASACVGLLRDSAALRKAFRGALAAARALTWDTAAHEHERAYEAVVESRLRACS